ncbi:putative lipid II flippase FtsW [Ferrimonas senticii]|uniref:putative lipid II flippase FtsW n=1 Tax=Ferrimonas senticii TaxID=394566 RepID=UPI0003FA33A0|nr:putative lipid II flippase FtsW [Ferrimonas senticii]
MLMALKQRLGTQRSPARANAKRAPNADRFRWSLPVLRLPQASADPRLYDRLLLVLIVSLMMFGLLMVTSASLAEALKLKDNSLHFAMRQGFFVAVALLLLGAFSTVTIQTWERFRVPIALIALGLLIAVLVVGKTVNGAQRWIPIGPFNLQVAEVAKFALVVFMAGYLSRRSQEVREDIKGLIKGIAPLVVFGVLLIFQPDLGSGVVMLVITGGMLFLAGAPAGVFVGLVLAAILVVVIAIMGSDYRMARVQNFLDPWQDEYGAGYQLTQSLMAYGRGDWGGQGLGNSIQKLNYLPEAHTDFISSVIGEELGFLGIATIVLMQLALALRALWIGHLALRVEQAFAGYMAYGIGIWFSFQTAVNIGAAVGILPTKGLTLPLVSYGGSSLWVMTVAAAILVRIDFERRLAQSALVATPNAEQETP